LGRWLRLGPRLGMLRLGLGILGLRRRMALLGLGIRLGSLVVQPVLVRPVAGVLLLSGFLPGLQLRLVRQSAALPAGFSAEFVEWPRLAGQRHKRVKVGLQLDR
jgi:hypothetical protein